MKDYYAILGLDNDASPESLKLAYRRLAREAHPDRAGHLGPEAQARASSRMAELNEAYETLSDSLRRKDYDEEFRKWQARSGAEPAAAEAPPPPPPEPEIPAVTPERRSTRPAVGVSTNVVRQFATQIHNRLLTNAQAFAWRGLNFEGFDWAVHSSFLMAEYFVALRGFGNADAAASQKFLNYATLAMEKSKRMLKKNFFLLLMPFQRLSEPDHVLAQCRRFVAGDAPGPRSNIVLLDVTHGRTVACGPAIEDKRFAELLKALGLAR